MNDRERLVELIGKSPYGARKFADCFFRETIEKIADHIIAIGVTVQKQGKWEYHDCVCTGEGLAAVYACSACHACIDEEVFERLNATVYCPNCGAKMVNGDGK